MSLISKLPYDIIFQIEGYLTNKDLETLIEVFYGFYDNSIAFVAYSELSKKQFFISNFSHNELTYEEDHKCLVPTNALCYLAKLMRFDKFHGTKLIPKAIVLDFHLSDENIFAEFYSQAIKLFKKGIYDKQLNDSNFDLILLFDSPISFHQSTNLFQDLSATIGSMIQGISILNSAFNIDLRNITTLFNALKHIKIKGFNRQSRINYIPPTIDSLVFEDVNLDGTLIPTHTRSLMLKNVAFKCSSSLCFSNIEELTLCFIYDISGFIWQSWCNTLIYLYLSNIEFKSSGLEFQELHNLKHLELINVSDHFGYEFHCPHSLELLTIQDRYLLFISIDFNNLPQSLRSLTIRGDLPYKFDNILFPTSLKTLILQGGGGIFQCENFKCPPKLQKLIITLQKFRNVHKFKLAETTREVNLSSNKIKKITTMKFPSNIETLCLSNNSFLCISRAQFPMGMKRIDLTQAYSLTGEYDFTKYNLLCTANIFVSDSNKFAFNLNVKIINDYDWRVDREWKNRELSYFY